MQGSAAEQLGCLDDTASATGWRQSLGSLSPSEVTASLCGSLAQVLMDALFGVFLVTVSRTVCG